MKDQSLNINKKKEQLEIFKGRREKRKKTEEIMADEKLLHHHCDTSPEPWRGCGDTSNDMTEG